MSSKKQKQDRLERKYTYPEFLKEFFPNIKPGEDIEEEEGTVTQEEFLDILKQITSSTPPKHTLKKVKTSG